MFEAHQGMGWFLIFANGLVGVWMLLTLWTPAAQLATPALDWWRNVAHGSVVLQVVFGVILTELRDIDPSSMTMHLFYGVVAVIALCLGYIYARETEWVQDRRQMFDGLLSLFIMGLGIRAVLQVV